MSMTTFPGLVQALVQQLALPVTVDGDPDEPLHGFEFDHFGMTVRLVEDGPDEEPRVLVFCDFGVLPAAAELEGLRKLMEINLFLGAQGYSVFGRDAASGAINFRFDQDLAHLHLDTFVNALDQLAAQAAEWRQTWFLDDAGEETPSFSDFLMA